jgi:hypothetical protein
MGILVSVAQRTRFDPLGHGLELPLTGTFYPAGFPLHIVTNSQQVLDAATESWGHARREYDTDPIRFRVVVQPEGELAAQPSFRSQGHLLSVVSDADNFCSADMRELFASFHLSEKTAADHPWLRWFYIESMAYMLLAQRHVVPVHAGFVARGDAGILLCGQSGAGKSTLSYACARAGWTFLADDCTWLLADSKDRVAVGRPQQARFRDDAARHFPELEGMVARARPNGKLSLEVPTGLLGIETATRCPVAALVFLDRESGGLPRAESITSPEAVSLLLDDMPNYADEVNAMYERTVNALLGVPAWRLHYQSLDDAIRILAEIQPQALI